MMRNELIIEIKNLSNELDMLYRNTSKFRNHCYLRIAYDNTCMSKWDIVIEKPFIKNASISQLTSSLIELLKYKENYNYLMLSNTASLKLRNKI